MRLTEIINNNRNKLLTAVEHWLEGDALLQPSQRQQLASDIKKLATNDLKPTVGTAYRAIQLNNKLIEILKSGKSIKLNQQGASSFSGSFDLANWFFDEVLGPNSIIFKKNIVKSAIIDFNKLRNSMTPDEKSEFSLLAYGDDHEIIVLDSPDMIIISPSEIVKMK